MAKEKMYELANGDDNFFEDFDALAKYVQQTCRKPISYKVVQILSPPPHSRVRIKIIHPNGRINFWSGASKKEAANTYARQLRPSDV